MLPDLKGLFDMDRLLKRTYLILCPVEIYRDLLDTRLFSCLELCVTMKNILCEKPSSSYTETFVSIIISQR